MRLRRRLPVLFLALILLTVSLGLLLAVHLNGQVQASRQALWHGFRVSDAARTLFADLQDAETGQRGFILTGEDAYLAAYELSISRIGPHLERLYSLMASDPAQAEQQRELRTLIEARLAALAEGLRLAGAEGEAGGPRTGAMIADPGQLHAIRAQVEEILLYQQTVTDALIARAEAADERNIAIALGGFVLALLVIIGGALMLMRGNGRLRRAEAALAEKSGVLQATLDNIQDGVVAFDAAGRLAACNRRLFDMLGFPQALARPGTPLAAFNAIDRRRDLPVLTGPEPPRGASDLGTPITLGGNELEVYRNPMPDGGFVLSCIDVTRRAQAEASLRQSQKMEAVGQLTGGIAHDFNNLLQIITANLELLKREMRGMEPALRYLNSAQAGVGRGARLTAQLLAFARQQPLDPRVLSPARLVSEMTDLLRRTLGERIEVRAVLGEEPWNTLVDPSQLENALLNLAINARDAMPEGGVLTLEVSNAELDETHADGPMEAEPGQYALIVVSDTGAGMRPEVLARAFEPFYTTKPEGQGTGLGLSQVYGFVRQSGGHVKIASRPGQGTAVRLYLPRSRQPKEALGELPAAVPGGGETILVVEDDPGVRGAVVDMLRDLGYRVLQADGPEMALAVLSSGTPVDLMFTDVVMPGPMRARELAHCARQRVPGLRVLFTSGYAANAITHDGRLDEDVQLLSKPYRREELARHLRHALEAPAVQAPVSHAQASPGGGAPPDGRPIGGPAGGEGAEWPEGATVLVVEDDPLIRMNMAQMIEIIGLRPVEAGRAEKALDWLRGGTAPLLMVTDLSLPGMDGIALALEARKLFPRLPVLLVTGHAEASVKVPPELRPGVGFLGKPFAMPQLESAMRALWREAAAG